jgi:large subunit ribosomal protein L18
MVISRSARHISVQVVDDVLGRTLASASTMEKDLKAKSDDKSAKSR